jgi:hypothetical protein
VFASYQQADVRARKKELRRLFSASVRPITLETNDGAVLEELERLHTSEPQHGAGKPFVRRFSVAFDLPSADATAATILVPFVDLNDFDDSATVNLRGVPMEFALGPHRFRITKVEHFGSDEVRVSLEPATSSAEPRVLHPARMQSAQSDEFSWGGSPEAGGSFWLATRVGDPPIVTFRGVVLRVAGPWNLAFPLQ